MLRPEAVTDDEEYVVLRRTPCGAACKNEEGKECKGEKSVSPRAHVREYTLKSVPEQFQDE